MDLEDADLTNVQYEIENAEGYRYLVFYGRKLSDTVPATITVYDDIGEMATELTIMPEDVDGERHQYVINLPQISGSCSIVFDGGAEQAEEGGFVFGNITLM